MSVFTRPAGIRAVLRQLAVATALCAAFAAPAAFTADSGTAAPASATSVASAEDNNWPAPSPASVAPLN